MFMAQLILSGSGKERLKTAYRIIKKVLGVTSIKEKGHPDLIVLQSTNSLGINQIRDLQQKLALKPYLAPVKVALITQAEKLTIPAQNSLLKTLEEPPAKTLIILLSPKKEALLPTIVSRCQILQLPQKPEIEIDEKSITYHLSRITTILESSPGQRIKLAQEFANRQDALHLVKNFLWLWRELLLVKAGTKKDKILKKLSHLSLSQIKTAIKNTEIIRAMLEANVNPRLGVENLFLAYPNLKQKT